MKIRSQFAFSLVWAIIGVGVMAIGSGAVLYVVRSNMQQQQQLTAQAQRATYTTFQQEVTLHGIDPTKVINPLGAIAAPVEGASGGERAVNLIDVSTNIASSAPGSARVESVAVQGAEATGERSGGLGLAIVAGGDPNVTPVTPLNGPTFAPGLVPLTVGSFPATSWVILPPNPPGTVYRYTVDGSVPNWGSPVWNMAAATAVNVANFPGTMQIAAFNSDPSYSTSSVARLGPITMLLPSVAMVRNSGGSSTIFTYWDMTGGPPNGMLFAPGVNLPGVSLAIRYTFDGSDPRTSPTTTTYTGNFVVPFSFWNTAPIPATAIVHAILVGPDTRYTPVLTTFGLSNQVVSMPPPTFTVSSASGPLSEGTVVGLLNTVPGAIIRYAKWSDPSNESIISSSASIP